MSRSPNNTQHQTFSISSSREQGNTSLGTDHIIHAPLFSKQDLADSPDTDASTDKWDEEEYDRQMRVILMDRYEKKILVEIRRICKARRLKVRGNKDELVERLAQDHVQKMYHGGGGGEKQGEQ
ncbi:hypothetical protein SVAN01_10656 [Stagonosporopsis vannaccii]|nr:hypothetical protein SVAN01_10656 [Stagonosporopsis vannaccii]